MKKFKKGHVYILTSKGIKDKRYINEIRPIEDIEVSDIIYESYIETRGYSHGM